MSKPGVNNCILKAKVRASQRMKENHDAWVGISDNGSVITGHCSCMAG